MASNRKIESLLKSLDLKVDPSTIVQIKDLLEKIEASSISSDSLDIDFTDTLSYVTENNKDIPFGFFPFGMGGYVDVDVSGDFIGSEYDGSTDLISFGITDGSLIGQPLEIPGAFLNSILVVESGDYSGSVIFNSLGTVDQTGFGGGIARSLNVAGNFVDTVSGDKIQMGHIIGIGNSPYHTVAYKRNSSLERIRISIDDSSTGFVLDNDLSDNTASVLRIEDNNGDAILEFFNDYLVSETIPALDYADDAAAATGGVPVGGIYHNSGTIRIRLT